MVLKPTSRIEEQLDNRLIMIEKDKCRIKPNYCLLMPIA